MNTVKIYISEGPHKGLTREFSGFPISIGRMGDNDLVLPKDEYVSRRHCVIIAKGRSFFIEDLKSTHGTYLNGVKIKRRSRIDTKKDFLIIGSTMINFMDAGDPFISDEAIKEKLTCNFVLSKSIIIPSFKTAKQKKEALFVIDISKSTEFIHKYGDDAFLKLMVAISTVLEPKAKQNHVLFLKCTGDGFFATFATADQAVETAFHVRKKLKKISRDFDEFEFPGIRIGLHYGLLYEDKTGDRVGKSTHLVFRLQSATEKECVDKNKKEFGIDNKNIISITEDFYKALHKDKFRKDFRFCGKYLFKGFDSSVKIYAHNEPEKKKRLLFR
jgi:class 3 adenylate cyclase